MSWMKYLVSLLRGWDTKSVLFAMSTKINLFTPFINKEIRLAVYDALGDRIIGQGEKVEEFERLLAKKLGTKNILTVNSGTSALGLACHLLNLKEGDEVVSCRVYQLDNS